jgi:two-component system, chemotaxis family, sensor kinase CheA
VYLADVLGDERRTGGAVNIVVLEAGDRTFGLVVDSIEDTAEIVVKPLGRLLKHLSIFAGATIMGDGHIALMLDVIGVAGAAGLLTDIHDFGRTQDVAGDAADADRRALLLFTLCGDRRFALPLSAVARLEEIAPDQLEHSGNAVVVQYRGDILPLIDLADVLERGAGSLLDRDPVQVVVYQRGDASFGLVVGAITDIVEESLEGHPGLDVPGLAGSAVVQGRVTDLVDVDDVLALSGIAVR